LKLYLTRCSYQKRTGKYSPDKLYISSTIAQFIDYCQKDFLPWAILSAKHGLFFPDEQHEDYNVTWKSDAQGRCIVIDEGKKLSISQSAEYNERLTQKITRQAKNKGVSSVVFYTPNPLRTKCYLSMLHRAIQGCRVPHKNFSYIIEHIKEITDKEANLHHITKLK